MSATEHREVVGSEQAQQLGWLVAILDLMPTPMLLIEPGSARVTFANKAADRMAGGEFPRGYTREDYHQAYFCTDAEGRRIPNEEMPGVRAARGERLQNFEMDWHTPDGVRSLLIFTDTVPASFGHAETIICAFDDVTALKRAELQERTARERAELAERRARFLAEAGAVLTESLDYEETLRRLANLVVPERAHWCAIDMLGDDGTIERVALAHTHPEKERLGWELLERWPQTVDDPEGVARVLRTGEPLLYPEIADELLEAVARDEEHLRVMRELGLRSAMVMPLRAHGRVLGTLTFANDASGRAFDEQDLALAQELATRAAVAVDNALLYSTSNAIARTLQDSLLPPHLPAIRGLELAGRYRAAGDVNEVGGDFYDVFPLRDGRWALVIGDVCGKGVEAAALTGLMRYTLRATAMNNEDPREVLAQLNEAILRQRGDNRFSTALFVRLEVGEDDVDICMASGGHPLPLVVHPDGTVESVGTPGTLLGVLPEVSHVDAASTLAPGDALVLFTDGLIEAGAPHQEMTPETLIELAASCAGLPAPEIARRIEEHAVQLQGAGARDDLALLVAVVPER